MAGIYQNLDIFEKETKSYIRSFFYERRKRRVRIFTAAIIIPLIILGSSQLVKADLFYFYSPLCLGSWAYVRNVEGEPQLTFGADVSEFNNSNSAVLKNSSGQIFCGRFESTDSPENNINSVKLKLSIAILEDKPILYSPEDIEKGATLEAEEGQDAVFIIETPATIGGESPEETEIPPPISTPVPNNVPTPTVELTLPPTLTPEPSVEPTLDVEPQPTPTPTPELESDQPSSLLKKIIHFAYAQELQQDNLNLDDLLSVQYTLDGEGWNELGRVTRSNWKDLDFKIPVNSLEELSGLQIAILSLPTLDSTATVYLDSMWLELETDPQVVEFIQDIAETIFETITLQNLTNSEETAQPTPELKEPKLIKIKEYDFKIGGTEKADDELEWYSREDIEKFEKVLAGRLDRNINVVTENGSKALVIFGSCRDKFYVVLLYRNREDYAKNPSLAVYNSAFECTGTINHRLETENLTGGDYWLLIGEQGDTGTWIPISDLRKIKVGITEKEIEQ